MFTNAYKLARATGFEGTEAEFISALTNPPLKDHQMQNITPESFLGLINSFLSGDPRVSGIVVPSAGQSEFRQAMSGDMGMHYVPDQTFAGEPKNFEIPEKIVASGQPETIQNYITLRMIPDHLQKLAQAIETHKGFDLLREQRKILTRLNKLMSYQARPLSIIPTAIHDEYELSIYKNYIAQQICSTNLTVEEGLARVTEATESMMVRLEACRINEEKQAAEKKRKDLLSQLQAEIRALGEAAHRLDTTELALRLRGIAEQAAPTPAPERKDVANLHPANLAGPSAQDTIPPVLRGILGRLSGLSAEDLARVKMCSNSTHLHPMDGAMGDGMMSHHFANRD